MSILKEILQFKIDAVTSFIKDPRAAAIEKFVMRFGILRHGRPLPKGYRKGTIKMCYRNTTNLVLNKRDLTYYEGYALRKGLPIEMRHAWAVDKAGAVVDVTWRDTSDAEEYLGVPIPVDMMLEHQCLTGYYSVLWAGMLETPNWDILPKLEAALVETD